MHFLNTCYSLDVVNCCLFLRFSFVGGQFYFVVEQVCFMIGAVSFLTTT